MNLGYNNKIMKCPAIKNESPDGNRRLKLLTLNRNKL